MEPTSGIPHVTAIASNPQRNLDFYAEVLGLRLVKRTVNFDDPGTYHFYFAHAAETRESHAWGGAELRMDGPGDGIEVVFLSQ